MKIFGLKVFASWTLIMGISVSLFYSRHSDNDKISNYFIFLGLYFFVIILSMQIVIISSKGLKVYFFNPFKKAIAISFDQTNTISIRFPRGGIIATGGICINDKVFTTMLSKSELLKLSKILLQNGIETKEDNNSGFLKPPKED